jgi:hypothetical protein
MYNTIKNVWLDVTPKVHANVSHDDRIILEQETELNADMGHGHGEIVNDIGYGNGEGEGNGDVEGDGDADEWEDLNEDVDGDVDDVDDALQSIESRTGTFPLFSSTPLTSTPSSLHSSLSTSFHFTTLLSPFLSLHFISLLFCSILSTSLHNSSSSTPLHFTLLLIAYHSTV